MADYARIINRTMLQTPVHQYVHPETCQQITLIGTVHVGETAYYRNLRDLIEQREADGAVVQCEAGRRNEAVPNDLTPDEKDLIAELRRVKDQEEAAVAALGWIGQVQGLGYPKRWTGVDMQPIDIIRAAGPDVFLRQARRMARFLAKYENEPARAQTRFRAMAVTTLRVAARSRQATRSRGDDVIVHRRTKVALDGVASTDRDLVLIWGALHLPGLDAGLRLQGFTREATDWYDVVQLPTIFSVWWHVVRSTGHGRKVAAKPADPQNESGDTARIPLAAVAAGSRGTTGRSDGST